MTKPGLIQRAGARLWSITPAYAKLGEKSAIKPVTVHRATVVGSISGTVALLLAQTTVLGFEPDDVQNVLLLLLPASLILHSIIAFIICGPRFPKTKPTSTAEVPCPPDFVTSPGSLSSSGQPLSRPTPHRVMNKVNKEE